MKRAFSWIIILGLVLGVAPWAVAQQKPSSSQAGGAAASTFSNLCAGCHGATGKGDGPAAASLSPKPKDFADCKVMAKIPDDRLFTAIKKGGPSVGLSPLMPTWGASLTDPQIHELVRYIRGFCKK